jgi:signal transduction histidine kinase
VKARIARTIVGVTALVVVVLGIPLAIVIQRFYESRATVELRRSAAEAIAELTVPLRADEIADAATEPDAPADFSVYDGSGVRLYGTGPARLDTVEPDQIVVVSPITDRRSESVVGSVRVYTLRSEVHGQVRRTWALMAMAAAGGLILAMIVARSEAARLAAPISDLAARAERLGAGDVDMAPMVTGTPELDTLADALALSSRRLAELLAREREFSANASHQLRTPLAALRMSLERGDLEGATAEADRLSATVDHMLAFARDMLPTAEVIAIGPVVAATAERWAPAYLQDGRELVVTIGEGLPGARVRPTSIDQAVDVLLDNALRHGAGTTRVQARSSSGGVVVQVDDDGPGIDADRRDSVFERHQGSDNGIGLALARTLLEADGGRLLLSDPVQAEFRIVLTAEVVSTGSLPTRT